MVLLTGYLACGVAMLTVATQLRRNGEPGDDGKPTRASRVRTTLVSLVTCNVLSSQTNSDNLIDKVVLLLLTSAPS